MKARGRVRVRSYLGALILAGCLGQARPASATVTLHFTFGLTRQADACWEAGDLLKYRVAGQAYEIARADVVRIDGACRPAADAAAIAAAPSPPPAPAEAGPTDAMLAAGRASLPPPSWSPRARGGCRVRGIEAALRQVIDGDTIEVRMPDGHPEVVRYIGVNAPEVHHPDTGEDPGGRAAKTLNEALLKGKRLELTFDVQARDRHGRLLAYVYSNGEHVNAMLVERGHAAATSHRPNVCFADRFRSLERQARDGRRGLWGEPGQGAALVAAGAVNALAATGEAPSADGGASGAPAAPSAQDGSGRVPVRGHTRKDGTYVVPHTRSQPGPKDVSGNH